MNFNFQFMRFPAKKSTINCVWNVVTAMKLIIRIYFGLQTNLQLINFGQILRKIGQMKISKNTSLVSFSNLPYLEFMQKIKKIYSAYLRKCFSNIHTTYNIQHTHSNIRLMETQMNWQSLIYWSLCNLCCNCSHDFTFTFFSCLWWILWYNCFGIILFWYKYLSIMCSLTYNR